MINTLPKFVGVQLCSPLLTLASNFPKKTISVKSSMSTSSGSSSNAPFGRRKLMEFPHVSVPHKDLMVDLITTVETRLGSHLLPCSLPPDVEYYQNEAGSSQGTLQIRCGTNSSPIDFILESWLHCGLPSGGALNITSLSGYLNSSTDAPNFLIELIKSSPSSLVLILDLPPRKDIVLDPDYLKTFYEDTQLDQQRLSLISQLPEATPYFSSSLYIRSVVSPTAIFLRIETDESTSSNRMDEILKDHVGRIAKQVLEIWLDQCVFAKREVGESTRVDLKKRDDLVKKKTIEIDLGSSLPRLFGQETADRVLRAVQEVLSRST